MNDGRTEAYFYYYMIKMLFDKEKNVNEQVLFETKPNILFGCKGAIFAVILIFILISISPRILKYIGNMQVYLIKFVKTAFAYYTTLIIFLIIFILLLYILFKIISWYSTKYTLTDSRIIVKKGLLYTRKNYMFYSSIQDINSSQSLFARICGVATISVYSAFDNNQIELKNISKSSQVEEIIFNQMNLYTYQNPFQQRPQQYGMPPRGYYEYENNYPEYNQNYYPPDDYLNYQDPEGVITPQHNIKFNKEYYDDLDENIDSALRDLELKVNNKSNRQSHNNQVPEDSYSQYNDYSARDEYVPRDSYSQYHNPRYEEYENHFTDVNEGIAENSVNDENLTSEKIIEKHFKKFK